VSKLQSRATVISWEESEWTPTSVDVFFEELSVNSVL
jgi:hypothetical protein